MAAPDFMAREVTHVASHVGADRDVASVQEGRIATAAMAHLGAIEGLQRSASPLAKLVMRLLAPTANKLTQELLDAGYRIGREERR